MTQPRKQKVREELKKQRRRRVITTTIIFVVLASAGVIGAILIQQQSSDPSLIGKTIPDTLYANLAGVSNATLSSIGNGGTSSLQPETSSLLASNGKPEFLYIGADYCPYCAAERWSIVIALSRFGTFTSLEYMTSGDAPEAYPDTSTFSFVHATYSSQYIAFVSVELQDRLRNPQQTITSDEQNIMNQYDTNQGIPFIDLGNQYIYVSSQFLPSSINGLTWTQIGTQLDTPSSAVARSIDGAANRLITALCKLDNGMPTSLCTLPYANLSQMPISSQTPPGQFDPLIATDQVETRTIGPAR
jgi:hypothetical protein